MIATVAEPSGAATRELAVSQPAKQPNGFGMLANPDSVKAAREFAEMFAKSDIIPKAFQGKPGDIMIAGAMGARLGLDIFSALAGIAVVNGRPTLYGDAMLAVCQQRPDFEDITEAITGTGDAMAATVTVKRAGRSPYVSSYSMADAKIAGLTGKAGPWTQHPKRMLTMRARSFALRGAFADALAGFSAREEFDDIEDVTATATIVPEPTKAKGREVPTDTVTTNSEKTPEQHAEASAPRADAPPPLFSVNDLLTKVKAIAGQFGNEGMAAVKKFNDRLGIKKTQDCPPDQVAEAFKILAAFERELNETGKVTP